MSFADFPEQKFAVRLLQKSLDRGRLAHAYIFAGASLETLEDAARTLVKTLNCQAPPQRGQSGQPLDSCDRCSSCARIDSGNHPDAQWVRPESKSRIITIDQMRELIRIVHLKPTEAKFKAAVISAADRLNDQAANSFLKTLEEPPAQSILILLTTEPDRILETIFSRCLRLTFGGERPRAGAGGADWMAEFCRLAVSDKKAGLLGRYRLLDVLLGRLAVIKEEAAKTALARSPLSRHDDPDPKLAEKWEDELAAATEAEYRRNRSEALLSIQWWLRDVWLAALGTESSALSFPRLREYAEAAARGLAPEQAAGNIATLENTQRLLGSNVQEALALEVGLLKLKL